jgi:hypothetical protein
MFAVVLIGECRTSKLCPGCEKELKKFSRKDFRLWECTHGCKGIGTKEVNGKRASDCPLVVNKDYSAGINFFKILSHLIATGSRPDAFNQTQ